MVGELTIPILPCRLLDDVLPFYEALGFEIVLRQDRPYAYAVVRRGDIRLHFCAPDGFDPEQSYASVIIVVADADALYRAFASGLRAAYGKLPRSGIPRLLAPRKKRGTAVGFSIVDPGGNWLRVYRAGDTEDEDDEAQGLTLLVRSAARQGDSRGDHALAAQMLDRGLARHADAPLNERLPALVYRTELAVRMGDHETARTSLAQIRALDLDDETRTLMASDLAAAVEIERELP